MSKFSKGIITGKEVQRVFHDAKLNQYALPAVNVTSTSTVNTVLETISYTTHSISFVINIAGSFLSPCCQSCIQGVPLKLFA